jgi:hypothetical protein
MRRTIIRVVAIMLFVLTSSSLPTLAQATFWNQNYPTGLVGWWKLGEGTGSIAYDSSGYGNNGIWVGAASGSSGHYSLGFVGPWAGDVQTSNSLNIPYSPALALNANFTYSIWVYFVVATPVSTYPILLGDDSHQGFSIRNSGPGTSVAAEFATDYPTCGGTSYTATGSMSPTVGTWHFFAATYDGTTVRLYVDGALSQSRAGPASSKMCSASSSNAPRIGGAGAPVGTHILLDDARIYSRVLSAQEIAWMYLAHN